jgi:O-antigen ligase
LTIWRQGLVAFTERPWLGGGVNTFRLVNSLGKVAHNTFLSVLVEVGLIGFLLFGLMLGTVVWQAWRQPRWEARLWLAMLATWVIGASTLTWEYRKPTWLLLSLVIVSGAVVHHVDADLEDEPAADPLPPVYKENPAFV